MSIYQKRKSVIITELKKIEEKDGIVTPARVVEAAMDETSPLHRLFDWNDVTAAYNYRLWQARELINYVKVDINGKKMEGYHSIIVEVNNVKTQGYVSTERVASNEDFKNQIMKLALNEIAYWQQKYSDIDELKGVVNTLEIEKARRKLEAAQKEFEQLQQSA